MQYKIVKMQNNSSMCMVCGLANPYSLKAHFFETDEDLVLCQIRIDDKHQSYPDRVHGGMIAALLDEIMGRVNMIFDPMGFSITARLDTQFLLPVPLNEDFYMIARITRNTRLLYESSAELILSNGQIAATAQGKYVKIALEKIDKHHDEHGVWFYDSDYPVPEYLTIPDKTDS